MSTELETSPNEPRAEARGLGVAPSPGGGTEIDSPDLFESFLYGLAVVDRRGDVLFLNRLARQLLMPSNRESAKAEWTCCDLICGLLDPGFGGGCMADQATTTAGRLPEVRIEVGPEGARQGIWVTASPVTPDRSQLLFHLRPEPGRRSAGGPEVFPDGPDRHAGLHFTTLGQFQVEGEHGRLDGEWVEQRPGRLLKYLICERRRIASSDQIAEALWPKAGPGGGGNRLRYYVHTLREKLEPQRASRSPSRFIVSRRGGYLLDTAEVRIDADEFEREALAGLAAFVQDFAEPAVAHLDRALRLYSDGFLPDDPYEEWALEERERLHELACRALRASVRIQLRLGRLDAAAESARRLADMEPFDTDVHRMLIDVCLRRGRRSEAVRRYDVLRKRMLHSFGQEPDFELAELESQLNSQR